MLHNVLVRMTCCANLKGYPQIDSSGYELTMEKIALSPELVD